MKFRENILLVYSFIFTLMFFSVNFSWSQSHGYHPYPELKSLFTQLADEYSQIVKLNTHGQTLGEKEIFSLTIGSGKTDAKPAILMVAGVDGTDLAGTEVLLQYVQSITRDYGKVDSVTNLIDQTTFYLFPQVNPDASNAFFSKPQYARSLNMRPMDLDSDGKVDEDGYDDLNKDGYITWLRITEPGGEWLDDNEYPGLLKKADAGKGETGVYRLIREGIDNDGDGEINEDEPGGVNFNQNFTFKYKFFSTGAGFHQVSEIETRAVADFVFAHPNIAAVFSFSPNDNLNKAWEAPKGPAKKPGRGNREPVVQIDKKDEPYFAHVSELFKKMTHLTELSDSESGEGSFNEWGYYHYGRWSFSTPTWWPPLSSMELDTSSAKADSLQTPEKKPNQKSQKKPGEESKKTNSQRLWDWAKATDQTDAFVEWKEIKHPDFPDKKVEIGGFKPFPEHNPPGDSLQAIAERFYPFLFKLSSSLPKIDVSNMKVEDFHNNLFRITLNVVNNGYLPSNPQIGVPNKWCPKIKLAVKLSDNQKVVSGRVFHFIDRLEGSGGSEEVSWMVMGKKGETVKITIGSPMTGTVVKEIKLR